MGEEVPFFTYTREFDFCYILADFIVVSLYLSWLWRSGYRWPLLRGLIMGAFCYYVDAYIWYRTPVVTTSVDSSTDDDVPFQRTWQFTCENGVVLQRNGGSEGQQECELLGEMVDAQTAYKMLKSASDWMMTWSFGLLWFTYQTIVISLWIAHHRADGGAKKKSNSKSRPLYRSILWHSLIAFSAQFVVYPLSLMISTGKDIRAVGTRHMYDGEGWRFAYMAVTHALFLLYNLVPKRRSLQSCVRDLAFGWIVGWFHAFGMLAPLYLFRIRPFFELSRFLYEVLTLITRGSAEFLLTCDFFITLGDRLFHKKEAHDELTENGEKQHVQ